MLGVAGSDSKQLGGITVDSKILMWSKMKICHAPSGTTWHSSGYPTMALPQAQRESHWPVAHTSGGSQGSFLSSWWAGLQDLILVVIIIIIIIITIILL